MNNLEHGRVGQWVALMAASHSRWVVNIAMFSVSSPIAMLTSSTLCDRRTEGLSRKTPPPGRVVFAWCIWRARGQAKSISMCLLAMVGAGSAGEIY
jgi:hypothetical protein